MNASATLVDADGRWTLRFERQLAHPVEKVWRAITEPDHRDRWFPQRIVGPFEVGAEVRFVDDPNMPAEGFGGRWTTIDPPHLLELEWGTDRLRIELTEVAGGCRLVFTDQLSDTEHAARTAAGWHLCLDSLDAELDGRPIPELDEARFYEVHDAYLVDMPGPRHVWGPPAG
jgi:uncharacterized protein YndB with AHSA1/START domain